MKTTRPPALRRLSFAALSALCVAACVWPVLGHAAADFPNKPITMVVPVPPGGSTDAIARMITENLQKTWGQPVIVESKPGASTMIATQYVAKAPADGYTLLFTLTSFLTNPSLYAKPGYDANTSFVPVSQVVNIGAVLVASSKLGVGNMGEFVKYAKTNPGKLTFATTGLGSPQQIYLEMINDAAKIEMVHIPYKGGAPIITDLLGGQIDAGFLDPGTYRSLLSSGKIRGMAINGPQRDPSLPDVPTFMELGIPGPSTTGWYGVFAPAGTPPDVVAKLSAQIASFMQLPETRAKVAEAYGATAVGSSSDQFKAKVRREFDAWAAAIKKYNIRLE